MRGVQLLLTVVAAACLFAAITGIQSFTIPSAPGAPRTLGFETVSGRALMFGLGATLMATAILLPRRPRLAWWLGWVVGALGVVDAFSRTVFRGPRDHPPDMLFDYVLPSFGIALVAVYWAVWWYRRRSRFITDDDPTA